MKHTPITNIGSARHYIELARKKGYELAETTLVGDASRWWDMLMSCAKDIRFDDRLDLNIHEEHEVACLFEQVASNHVPELRRISPDLFVAPNIVKQVFDEYAAFQKEQRKQLQLEKDQRHAERLLKKAARAVEAQAKIQEQSDAALKLIESWKTMTDGARFIAIWVAKAFVDHPKTEALSRVQVAKQHVQRIYETEPRLRVKVPDRNDLKKGLGIGAAALVQAGHDIYESKPQPVPVAV